MEQKPTPDGQEPDRNVEEKSARKRKAWRRPGLERMPLSETLSSNFLLGANDGLTYYS
jgi:hypothetical protein